MNINLLPQENIRNRAPFFATIGLLMISLLLASIYGFLFMKNNTEVKSKKQELQQQQLLLAKLNLETETLKKEQATKMQEKILSIRQGAVSVGPIIDELERAVFDDDNEILEYAFELPGREPVTVDGEEAPPPPEDELLTSEGEPYFVLELNIESISVNAFADVLTRLEKLEWLDKVYFKNMKVEDKGEEAAAANANSSNVANVLYELHVVPTKLPKKEGE